MMKFARLIVIYLSIAALSAPIAANSFMSCDGGETSEHQHGTDHPSPAQDLHHAHGDEQGNSGEFETMDCDCCGALCAMAGCASMAIALFALISFELPAVKVKMDLDQANPNALPGKLYRPPIIRV